jgi:hypothetical protein
LAIPAQSYHKRSTVLSNNIRQDLSIEEFEFYSEPEIRVPGWFLKPSSGGSRRGVVVILSSSGKNRLFNDQGLLAVVNKLNIALCSIDLRAAGEATPRLPPSGPLFYGHEIEMAYSLVSFAAGIPLIGQRVSDFLACLDYLEKRSDVDPSHMSVFGRESKGLEALFGAALSDRVCSVLLERTLADYASVVASPDYNLKVASFPFGLLRHFDLPQISELIAPHPVWLLNPVSAQGNGLTSSEAGALYGSSAKTFVTSDAAGKMFADWVTSTMA